MLYRDIAKRRFQGSISHIYWLKNIICDLCHFYHPNKPQTFFIIHFSIICICTNKINNWPNPLRKKGHILFFCRGMPPLPAMPPIPFFPSKKYPSIHLCPHLLASAMAINGMEMRDPASLPQNGPPFFSIRTQPASRLSFFPFPDKFNKNSLFHSPNFFYIFLIFDALFWTTNRPYPFSATPHPPIPYPSSIHPLPLTFPRSFGKTGPFCQPKEFLYCLGQFQRAGFCPRPSKVIYVPPSTNSSPSVFLSSFFSGSLGRWPPTFCHCCKKCDRLGIQLDEENMEKREGDWPKREKMARGFLAKIGRVLPENDWKSVGQIWPHCPLINDQIFNSINTKT